MSKRYFQIYTGDGKGKTTAALGLALRAAGHGLRIYIGQFMKGRRCGELKACTLLAPLIVLEQYGRKHFMERDAAPEERDLQAAKRGLEKAKEALFSGKYDIIILDEIISAHSFNLITVQELIELSRMRPADTELVFTGRGAPQELIEKADLVTEMKEIKHYYHKGIKARRGIEL